MKKTLFIILCFIIVLAICSCGEQKQEMVHPDTGEYTCEFNDETKEATVTGYTGSDTEIVVSEKFGDYTVTAIGRGAFSHNYDIEKVDIPSSVVSIGASAFEFCISLEEIKLTNGLVSIDNTAFKDCRSLKAFVVPVGVKEIGVGVFNGCDSLEKIQVEEGNEYFTADDYGALLDKKQTRILQYPIGCTRARYQMADSVKSIDGYAFERAVRLENVVFSESLETIGGSAFQGSSIKKADFSKTKLKEIGAFGFNETKLMEVKFSATLEKIGSSAFGWCSAITEVNIPASVNNIGAAAFYECFSVAKYVVEEGNEYYSSFDGVLFNKEKTSLIQYPAAREIKEYTIPNGVVEIKSNAFVSAVYLESVVVPDSVERIEAQAFYYCSLLSKVTYEGTAPSSIGEKAFELTQVNK